MTSSIDIILFILISYVMGFIAAIPIGATQIEIARRSLNGFPASALMIVLGSVISDTTYGAIAMFGIAPFLEDRTVVAVFWMVNAFILVILGIWAIRESRTSSIDELRNLKILKKHNVAFITGFTLAVTNPVMIFWWLLGSRFLVDTGLIQKFALDDTLLFLFSGAMGIGSYLTLLTLGVSKAKRFFTVNGIKWITFLFGTVMLCLASYFIFQSAMTFIDFDNLPRISIRMNINSLQPRSLRLRI